MSELIKEFELETGTLKVYSDSDPMSPRDWASTKMSCLHRDFWLTEIGSTSEAMHENCEEIERDGGVVYPVWAYIHGGISLGIDRDGQRSDAWDSGQIGMITIDKKTMDREGITKKQAQAIIKGELEAMEHATNGRCYVGEFENHLTGETDGPIGGFLGWLDDVVMHIGESFLSEKQLDELKELI